MRAGTNPQSLLQDTKHYKSEIIVKWFNSYFHHQVDPVTREFTGPDITFVYPDFRSGIQGAFYKDSAWLKCVFTNSDYVS